MSAVTVWYTRCPVPTALGIAVNRGLLDGPLDAEGSAVRSLADGEPAARQAHFAQDLPALLRHGGNVPVLVSASRGADVRVVGMSWPEFYEPVLVLPDSGIERVSDLKGRRLGVPRRLNDAVDFWRPTVLHGFDRALTTAGLRLDDVDLVDIPVARSFLDGADAMRTGSSLWDAAALIGQQREEAFALLAGEVDAIFSHASLAANVQGFTGARALIDVGALPDRRLRVNNGVPQVLTVTGDLLDRRSEVVARILARVIEAAAWAADHPGPARTMVADEVGLPSALVDLAYPGGVTSLLDVDLSRERRDGLAAQAAWLDDNGFLDRPVDVDALIDPRPLEAARELVRTPVLTG